jgi:hypothetical protein
MKYKNRILYTFLVVFLAVSSAGTVIGQEVKFGLKGGMNVSHLTIDGANDKNIIPGYHFGGFVGIPLAGSFSIQPELLFSTKGTKWVEESSTFSSDVRLKLNYIELPVKLVYNLARDLDFQVGPYMGFLLGANSDTKIISGTGSVNFSNELKKENFNSTDFGLHGGMRFYLNPIYLGFSYKLGLSEVAKEGKNARIFLDDASNRSIRIYAGFAF